MGLMANLRQFSSIFRRKCQKNAVFHRKKPAIGENARAFREKSPGPALCACSPAGEGAGGAGRFSACAAGKIGRMPNKGLILFVIREK